jgi:hypothetical protein
MNELLVLWIVCGLAAGFIGWSKGRSPVLTFVAGFLFGLIALVIIVLMPRARRYRY